MYRSAQNDVLGARTKVGWKLMSFVRSLRATRASRATNPHPSGLVALDLAESRQSYEYVSWHCTQPRVAKAGVALVGNNDSETARLLPSDDDARCWRAGRGMRHAELRGEGAAAIVAKPASALFYDTAERYLVWVCGRVLGWDER